MRMCGYHAHDCSVHCCMPPCIDDVLMSALIKLRAYRYDCGYLTGRVTRSCLADCRAGARSCAPSAAEMQACRAAAVSSKAGDKDCRQAASSCCLSPMREMNRFKPTATSMSCTTPVSLMAGKPVCGPLTKSHGLQTMCVHKLSCIQQRDDQKHRHEQVSIVPGAESITASLSSSKSVCEFESLNGVLGEEPGKINSQCCASVQLPERFPGDCRWCE